MRDNQTHTPRLPCSGVSYVREVSWRCTFVAQSPRNREDRDELASTCTFLRERLLSGSFYDSFPVTASGKSRPVPACHAALKRMFNAF